MMMWDKVEMNENDDRLYLISLFQRNWMQVIHFRPNLN